MQNGSGNEPVGDAFLPTTTTKITTGSVAFDDLLGGGLPTSSIIDVFGAAGTGKTQFAFQNAMTTSWDVQDSSAHSHSRANTYLPRVAFIDCAGSFRPERIVEIADARSVSPTPILDRISSISVRNVEEQRRATMRLESEPTFSHVRLIIVDDVTSNFVHDYPGEEEVMERHRALQLYTRSLALLAVKRKISVLFTNSIRSRGELGESETMGQVISAIALFRLRFSRKNRERYAALAQPRLDRPRIAFQIEPGGIY